MNFNSTKVLLILLALIFCQACTDSKQPRPASSSKRLSKNQTTLVGYDLHNLPECIAYHFRNDLPASDSDLAQQEWSTCQKAIIKKISSDIGKISSGKVYNYNPAYAAWKHPDLLVFATKDEHKAIRKYLDNLADKYYNSDWISTAYFEANQEADQLLMKKFYNSFSTLVSGISHFPKANLPDESLKKSPTAIFHTQKIHCLRRTYSNSNLSINKNPKDASLTITFFQFYRQVGKPEDRVYLVVPTGLTTQIKIGHSALIRLPLMRLKPGKKIEQAFRISPFVNPNHIVISEYDPILEKTNRVGYLRITAFNEKPDKKIDFEK